METCERNQRQVMEVSSKIAMKSRTPHLQNSATIVRETGSKGVETNGSMMPYISSSVSLSGSLVNGSSTSDVVDGISSERNFTGDLQCGNDMPVSECQPSASIAPCSASTSEICVPALQAATAEQSMPQSSRKRLPREGEYRRRHVSHVANAF